MERTVAELSTEEFEELVEHTIDRRIDVWFTQLIDTLTGLQEEEGAELEHEFAASLRRVLEQARSEEGIDLKTLCSRSFIATKSGN